LSTEYITDEEILDLASSAPILQSDRFYIASIDYQNAGSVSQIATDAVAKRTFRTTIEQERISMELVRTHTSIPVPKCDRSVTPPTGHVYLIQQYIPGRILHDVWPSLGWWNRFRVALTLRYYIHQLRSLSGRLGPLPVPGPPAINGEAQRCTGRLFTSDGSGPFSSYGEMARW
jgi:hypothetical protein